MTRDEFEIVWPTMLLTKRGFETDIFPKSFLESDEGEKVSQAFKILQRDGWERFYGSESSWCYSTDPEKQADIKRHLCPHCKGQP